jgi:hypothetical protein
VRHLRAPAGILAVFWLGYLTVRATNTSGWDEWLVVDLTWRGIVGLPYENRPFSLLFNLPGALLLPASLAGYWLAHGIYLSLTGVLVHRLSLRLSPGRESMALLAGVFCVVWAPLDRMRLDAVLLSNYSGFTFGTILTLVLLVETAHAGRRLGLALAAGLAFVMIRGLESTAGPLVAGPALLWLCPGIDRKTRVRWSVGWSVATGLAVALAAAPLLPGRTASYQVSALRLDLHPLRIAGRLLQQLAFHLGPLVSPSPARGLLVLLPVAVFAVSWWLRARGGASDRVPVRDAVRMAAIGLGLALLAYGVLVLSPSIVTPARMQILSAPGIGLLLAALVVALADRTPGVGREVVAIALGGYVVLQGTAHTAALQKEWDSHGFWAGQSRGLADLVREAPQLEANTFVLLLDEAGAWPATFTFRHALRYLYGGRVQGTVWNAEPFLYPIRVERDGIVSLPYESIREPWRMPATRHRWDEVVVARQSASGALAVLDRWPEESLPPLPPGAVYAPRARIRNDLPRPPQHALVLGPPGLW